MKIRRLKKYLIHPYILLGILILTYMVFFSILSISKYRNLNDGIFDLGNMNQTIWNTLHGHFFMETDPRGGSMLVSRLSDHADLILLLIAPFYALFSQVHFLLILQSITVALGAIPVFLYAKEKTHSLYLPLLFAFLFLLMPSVEDPNLFDFHPVTLGITFILFAFYFLYKKKIYTAIPFIILALITKEEVGFTLALLGAYFLLLNLFPGIGIRQFFKQRKILLHTLHERFNTKKKENVWFLGITCTTFLYSALMIGLIIPLFRQGPSLYLGNYAAFIHTPLGAIRDQIIPTLDYTRALLYQFGGISLFSPGLLLIAFPEWVIDVLSGNHSMQSIYFQYPAVIDPFIILSAISGFIAADRFLKKKFVYYKQIFLILFVVGWSMFASYHAGLLPYSRYNGPVRDYVATLSKQDKSTLHSLAQLIPPTASISADNYLGSYFSSRPYIYLYPANSQIADYIIVRNAIDLSSNTNYEPVYLGDGVYVYQKKA